ncbi:MAG: hypothetical protein QOD77_836 [Thermoplasmata archaeon]|jgi:predicted acyl esterase|nr:hypothetical protein [Thermoplasmata archaeon]
MSAHPRFPLMHKTVVALLVAALLAGCVNPDPSGSDEPAPARLRAEDIVVPAGATLKAIEGGFALAFGADKLPFEFSLPAGATMVRATSDDVRLTMVNADTGRRRCNTPTVESFSVSHGPPYTCSSVAALDEAGAKWRVGGTGSGAVRVELLDLPLDGLAGMVRLDGLSKPTLKLQETQVLAVPSFDGTTLRVEVTIPEGDGPWPAIIESSPYHGDGARDAPASWAYFVQDWAKRGYAVVVADVRGFGHSGGCVEVWGPNEQADQRFLVDWTAKQSWSNGRVGFYGQSYVATTPVEAAVQAPEALKAIIAVAPVINAYNDWHFGGVPNGENALSPVAYQAQTDSQEPSTDPAFLLSSASNGPCDPALVVRANDPRAVYDAFYRERDFSRRAGEVRAAVLYTQGFEDANVKSAMIPGWFNELQGPKLGVFGHWLHQHPSRLDTELLMVAWMDHYVKGVDLGLDQLPQAVITADRGRERYADTWPPVEPEVATLHADFAGGTLGPDPADGSATLALDPAGTGTSPLGDDLLVTLEGTLDAPLALAGTGLLHVAGTLEGAANAYVAAYLYDGANLVAWGQFNMAHRDGHEAFSPVVPGNRIAFDLPLRPTEHVFEAGSTLRLELRGVTAADAVHPGGILGARFTFEGGPDGTALLLPTVPADSYHAIPLSAMP